LLWLAAQTYLLCLASFVIGVVITALVLRNRNSRPAQALEEAHEGPETAELSACEDEPEPMAINART
jgi:hypothetical protein